jgi:hypothetical protein
MEFKNVAELHDFIEEEARKRIERMSFRQAKGVRNAN